MSLLNAIKPAPPEVIAQRLATCRACPHHGDHPLLREICTACGCPLATKTRFHKPTCPKGKWGTT